VGILPEVLESRALISALLFTVLVAGGAPWRIASHEHEGHGRVWLPDVAHLLASHGRAHAPREQAHATKAASCCSERCACCPEPCAPAEDPCCPHDEQHGHCHCDDQSLVTGVPFALVELAAHAPAGSVVEVPHVLCRLGAPEVAPSETEWGRVACEEDPIVLLR
jgi:hypothetical protein